MGAQMSGQEQCQSTSISSESDGVLVAPANDNEKIGIESVREIDLGIDSAVEVTKIIGGCPAAALLGTCLFPATRRAPRHILMRANIAARAAFTDFSNGDLDALIARNLVAI